MASISACSRLHAASGWVIISGASSASCPAAACSRYSFAIADGWGVRVNASFGGVRPHPAIAAPMETMSSTGSDMAPQQADPDEF